MMNAWWLLVICPVSACIGAVCMALMVTAKREDEAIRDAMLEVWGEDE